MSDIIEHKIKELMIRIKEKDIEIKNLKEKLEYFIDKFGLPENWNDEFLKKQDKNTLKNSEDDLIILKDKEKENNVREIHKNLVNNALSDLLKVQMLDLLQMLSEENKQINLKIQAIQNLKERWKQVNK